MLRANVIKLGLLITLAAFIGTTSAFAAEVTDVLDAADKVYLEDQLVDNYFDISLMPVFKQRYEWAKIKREYQDIQTSSVRLLNEMKYERVVNQLDIELEIGLYHDLALRANLPIILSDQSSYGFDDDKFTVYNQSTGLNEETWVRPDNSFFSNSNTSHPKYFDLVEGEMLRGVKRAGIGDLEIGIAWSPINTERRYDPSEPWKDNHGRSTVTLAFDYVAPTGKTKTIHNDAVGRGVHELLFSVAASHRYKFVDPYLRLQYGLPINDSNSAFKDFGRNQSRKGPGMWGRADLGIEFIAYESLKLDFQHFVKIDLRGYFKYVGEGRDYSELMDAFGTNEACRDVTLADAKNNRCGWVAEKWSNAGVNNIEAIGNGTYTGTFSEDGIFDHEGYAVVGGALNLYIQPVQWVQIHAGIAADYEQNHFITFTKVGKDRGTVGNDGKLQPNQGPDGVVTETSYDERNPTFSTALDASGRRIRKTEALNLEWFVGLKLMY